MQMLEKTPGQDSAVAWHVLHTQNQHEKNVARALVGKGFEVLLPLYSTVRRWKDRRVRLSLPLFPCYVFVQSPPLLAPNFVDSRSPQRGVLRGESVDRPLCRD